MGAAPAVPRWWRPVSQGWASGSGSTGRQAGYAARCTVSGSPCSARLSENAHYKVHVCGLRASAPCSPGSAIEWDYTQGPRGGFIGRV
ncbi:hypothetical protein NDU88_009249 [Pleurodeles waltl]|uniref:Uncharacterized protein n=1 Tax=Pleurodeles waltl TaxID=8319 RepID=A0AAV7QU19_PLEWA|nr:hypothetical protein NDU88_009249 [Pleurodeles waltl]